MSEPVNNAELVKTLLDGLTVKSRDDGSVHTVKNASGKTCAELCCGSRALRLNLRAAPKGKTPKSIKLGGKSTTWGGGGIVVTAANLAAARALLLAAVESPAHGKPAARTAGRKPAATAA